MGEGVAMRHTCNRRVEDAEEVGPPRGGAPVGGEGLDPSPLPMLCACRQHAGISTGRIGRTIRLDRGG